MTGRLIDADALYTLFVKMKSFGELTAKKAIRCVEEAPTVDAVPVIRCKDCKYWDGHWAGLNFSMCKAFDWKSKADDYCSFAERKEE